MVESVKVVLLGESGVGKSSLALRFVTNEFRPYTEATIGASFMSKQVVIEGGPSSQEEGEGGDENDNNAHKTESKSTTQQQQRHIGFKIWDTAGQEKYRSLAVSILLVCVSRYF